MEAKFLIDNSINDLLPLYNWAFSTEEINNNKQSREWAAAKNPKYAVESYSLSTVMFQQAVEYFDMNLNRHLQIRLIESGNLLPPPRMLNEMGNALTEECQLAASNHILYFLKYHSPNQSTVVDIGSGWGGCAKPLALLGYQVYSVDINEGHLKYQQEHFCDMPTKQSFLFNFWKKTNPKLLNEKNFATYCRAVQKNIHFIEGDMGNFATIAKINNNNWNIVLALDSLQFIDPEKKEQILKAVDNKLAKGGSFVLKMKHEYEPGKVPTYDFSIEKMYDEYFSTYKIINVSQDHEKRLNNITLVKP